MSHFQDADSFKKKKKKKKKKPPKARLNHYTSQFFQ